MEISGRKLADEILEDIKLRALKLTKQGSIPELAIVTVGGEDAWYSYVTQKLKTAERIGLKAKLIHLDGTSEDELFKILEELNADKNIHGIIVQRPLPSTFNRERIVSAIKNAKDIDGFRSDSPYTVPVVLAVQHFIREAYGVITGTDLKKVLINQSVLVVGKGETAGKPTIEWLNSERADYNTIDTKTSDPCQYIKNADIIISAVGKSNVINPSCLKKGVVLIGIGTHKHDGKIIGDYDEVAVKQIAKAYTPTPGGVGPLNLAYLFQNLVTAAEKAAKK